MNAESKILRAGVAKLTPALGRSGFHVDWGDEGVSSGGSFATCFFRKGAVEIGLIVRAPGELGCPNYSIGDGYAGHGDLLWALGHAGEGKLVSGDFLSYHAVDGGDPFDALLHDLITFVLAAYASPGHLENAITRAHKKGMDALFGRKC